MTLANKVPAEDMRQRAFDDAQDAYRVNVIAGAILDTIKSVLDSIKTALDSIYTRLSDRSQKTQLTDGTNDVGVVAGTPNRLAVDSIVTAEKYRAKFSTAQSIAISNVADTPILTITDAGKLEFISLVFSSAKAQAVINIDGTEELRINLETLGGIGAGEFSLGSANDQGALICTNNSATQIKIQWKEPVDFATSVAISARRTTAPVMNLDGAIVGWKKRI